MAKLRALVVDDSATVRERLVEVLESDPEISVVGRAENGRAAVELCGSLRPDVMTMDMAMPEMTGLEATEEIMAHFPTPILIVSSSVNRGDLFRTYDALAAGAVDVLEKPRGDETDDAWEARFLQAVRLVARIRVITHPRARLRPPRRDSSVGALVGSRQGSRILAIGASTGGPGAIVEVLRGIPADCGVPILVLLHIDEPFAAAFAEWLDGQTPHRVAYARPGQTLESACAQVTMAPPGRHLVVRSGRFELTSDPPQHSCRPSVDVLFDALARDSGATTAAALLTGMGRDGARGLLAIRRAGGFTIAQDERTSVVYGMPREAAQIGAADRILPLSEIGGALARAVTAKMP